MATTRTFRTTLSLSAFDGGETEFAMVLSYEFTAGSPESGRFGAPENYDPGSPDEVSISRLRLLKPDGTEEFEALAAAYLPFAEGDEDLLESLAADAREAEIADRDHAAEMKAEDRRMERAR